MFRFTIKVVWWKEVMTFLFMKNVVTTPKYAYTFHAQEGEFLKIMDRPVQQEIKKLMLPFVVNGRYMSYGQHTGTLNSINTLFESKEEIHDAICMTEECFAASFNILQSINTSVNPCDDFYSYACGKWIANHPVPATESHWNQFDILDEKLDRHVHQMLNAAIDDSDPAPVKNVKTVYRACMNTARLEERGAAPLVTLLEEFGGWPMAGWDEKDTNWQTLVGKVTNVLAVTPLLFAYVDIDKKNTSRSIITIDQPSLVLPRYVVDSVPGALEPYVKFVADAAKIVGKAYGFDVPSSAVLNEARALVRFEMRLARITKKEELRRDSRKMYHLVTIGELQHLTDSTPLNNEYARIQWRHFLSNVLGGKEDISEATQVVVTDLQFIFRLLKLLDTTPLRLIVNYIQWRVVRVMSRDVNQEMRKLNFRFKQQMSQVSEDQPRWRECVISAGYMSFAVGFMYVKEHFSSASREKAITMVKNIRLAFREELRQTEWMDDETKLAALQKADYMNYFIGYPAWYHNQSAILNYYEGLVVGSDHFENKIRLRTFLVRKTFEKLTKPTDRDEWLTSPAVVNAFYNPHVNSIIFPAAILQQPFFSESQPEALNYGSIGAVMGHEVSHGFDDMGRQSDKLGNIEQWWSESTEETYLKNAQCFIDQYKKYRVPELDDLLHQQVKVNGILTLGENIADNGGVRSAFQAYKHHSMHYKTKSFKDQRLPLLEHVTPDQLFFIGFAQVWCESATTTSLLSEVMGDSHAPHRHRVIGSLANSREFTKVWNCPEGSAMNPPDKCHLW